MVKVTCQLQTYGEKPTESIKIHAHWNDNNLVELQIGENKYVVRGYELVEAVRNSMNTCNFDRRLNK